MKKIAFHSNQLSIRGTEIALYQYAKYNEEILGNKSVIMTFPNRDMGAYQKFVDRFEVVIMEFSEYENYLKQNNFDCLYITKMGVNDGHFLESIKTIVHSVFRYNEPHGHEYMFISDWLAKDQGYSPSTNSLPYICEPLPIVEDNLRNSLNIPSDAKVFGAYAGREQFDINFVKEVIKDIVRKDPKMFFIFMNILEFDNHPNIKFLPSSYDLVKKSEFVNTCDYMIHARNQGETFGLAIAEFSLAGKPVITYGGSEERAHIEMLGEYGIIYNNPEELKDIFENTQKYLKYENYSIPYLIFSPENVMKKFNTLINTKNIINKDLKVLKVVNDNFTINVLANDSCGRSMFKNKSWEPHITQILKRNFQPDSVFVDVGSNYGWHSIISSPFCDMVYSFEPQKVIYDIQNTNITENNISNIKLFNCGIGNSNDIKEMSPIDYNVMSNMGDLSISVGGEAIEVRTLDSFQFPKVDFIKIDVQGYEKYVLEGAKNTITTSKPMIIIEMEDFQLKKFNYNVTELFELLRSLDYYIYFLDFDYPADHVCIHKDKLNKFIQTNNQYIKPLISSNNLNHNIENGVTEKIIYNQ
jgi:FkbM family methyltransferase